MTGSVFMNIINDPTVPLDINESKILKGEYYKNKSSIDFVFFFK